MVCIERDVRNRLALHLRALLEARPGQHKRELRSGLQALGWEDIDAHQINSVLYERGRGFQHDNQTPPTWWAGDTPTTTAGRLASDDDLPRHSLPGYAGPEPRAWQWEALDAWVDAERRGVVEAVTGTGKTIVGIMAASQAIARKKRVFVLVPGRDLLDQWYEQLATHLPAARSGRLGDGRHDTLVQHEILVSTVQSAYQYAVLPSRHSGLLIADEVHRYGAPTYASGLQPAFEERLGLTATYEREDRGIDIHLTPYFSNGARSGLKPREVVARCGYERGLADGILAPFRVGLFGVDFTPDETEDYAEWNEKATRARARLVNSYGCPKEPFGEFMRAVARLREGGNDNPCMTRCARGYLNAFTKRRAIMADCSRKIEALALAAPVVNKSQRALVFTETIRSADRAAQALTGCGVPAESYTSKLDQPQRHENLRQFRTGGVQVLAAPRKLDEGLDVPEADVGVIVAASHSRRQMIQRMGRVIRPKHDGRPATFLILYVRDTFEDPNHGGNYAFLNQIMDLGDVHYFPPGADGDDLLRWFDKS